MLSLIKIELNKVSKSKLFLAWLCTLFIVLGITAIIIMGLGTDNKLGEFTGQDSNLFRITGKWEGWAIVASLFSSLFTKAAFLIFESYLLSTIIIDEFKRRTIFQLFSYPIKQFIPTHVKSNMIDSLSDILVRWQCFKCHGQYECSVVKRHLEGCPYCDNKLMLKGYNTLQETHPYLEKFWDKSNDKPISEYWYKSSKCINWKCPCCKVSFYCSPIEMISRTDLENSNFQTCPNRCDWDTLVFNNDILFGFVENVTEVLKQKFLNATKTTNVVHIVLLRRLQKVIMILKQHILG